MKRVTRMEGFKRLLELANYVEKQPKDSFDTGSWYSHENADHDHGVKSGRALTKQQITACGTTACALGHCAVSPLGQRLGMSLVYTPDTFVGAEVRLKGMPGADAFKIAQAIFAISEEDSDYLFGAYDNMAPKEWAKRCREFVDYGRPDAE